MLPFIAWMGWNTASPLHAIGLVIAGFVGWSLFEYAMHRYLFHWTVQWAPARWLVYLAHGNHHDDPNDGMRNLMPPAVSLPIAGVIWLALVAAIGPAGTWAFLGFMIGYVSYDVVHYGCHQWAMHSRIGQAFKRHHMRHHHISESGNYAITALFWDRAFGTQITSLKR